MELRQRALRALQTSDIQGKVDQSSAIWSQFASFSIANDDIPEPPRPAGSTGAAEPGCAHAGAAALAVHGGGPRRADPCDLPHRVQRHKPRARCRLALCRDAGRLLPRLDAGGVRGSAALHPVARSPAEPGPPLRRFPGPRWPLGMCEKTRDDIVARMALVPRTLEARGLDATPLIQARLRKVGTPDALTACDLLDIILHDEIGHVTIGNPLVPAGCASATAWIRWPTTACWCSGTARRACALRSTRPHGARPVSARRNWTICWGLDSAQFPARARADNGAIGLHEGAGSVRA
jgi:hypothetical protein